MKKVLEEVQDKESRKTIDKRKLLALAAVAAAGLTIKPLVEGAHAKGNPLLIGEVNQAPLEAETILNTNTSEVPGETWKVGLFVNNSGETGEAIAGEAPFIGIHGASPAYAIFGECRGMAGTGVLGRSDESGIGIHGQSNKGIGVRAESKNGTALKVEGKGDCCSNIDGGEGFLVKNDGNIVGDKWPAAIYGDCKNGIGVLGWSQSGHGILGGCFDGIGVKGISENFWAVHGRTVTGVGVEGESISGIGLQGISDTGIGIEAISKGIALKVNGKSEITANVGGPTLTISNTSDKYDGAIYANAKSCTSIFAVSTGQIIQTGEPAGTPAVQGVSQYSFGIMGMSAAPSSDFMKWYTNPDRGTGGVLGYADTGKAVVGFSDTGVGVLAISKNSPALRVEGKSSFSTVGNGVIPRLRKSFTADVASGLITANSHISVTLMSDPGGDAAVSWVQRDPANNRFTINLTKAVGKDTAFTYFIVEP